MYVIYMELITGEFGFVDEVGFSLGPLRNAMIITNREDAELVKEHFRCPLTNDIMILSKNYY